MRGILLPGAKGTLSDVPVPTQKDSTPRSGALTLYGDSDVHAARQLHNIADPDRLRHRAGSRADEE